MKNTLKRCALLVASSSLLGAFSASAANTYYQAGDLMLYFQKLSGTSVTNTVYVDLGPATSYRGTATGTGDVANSINFLNINSTLSSAFGNDWASQTGIYAGIAGVYSAINNNTVTNGDVSRTLYVSAARDSIGTVGSANSVAWSFAGTTPFTTASGQIQSQNNIFGSFSTATINVASAEVDTATSGIDDQNPITVFQGNAFQDLAFGAFDGGVQQVGTSGTRGTYFEIGSDAEFALDLYRIVPTNNLSGEINGDIVGNLRTGTFEGTFAVNGDGQVSFITTAVPEPSSLALVGMAAGSLVLRRRRSVK